MELTKEQITARRERLGLSKSAFGRESGLHVSTISQIENGHLVPYPGQVKKMLAAFERLEAKALSQKVAS
ncbi:helix-turn-helix domain-containing protein [Thermophilibacter mediterraneus]|uniref:helix-turn-helix domain-containing protein n=1 Tax=Thermophilibacter mediterraneus TaxID=1871031 RepID=UPI00320B5417